MRNRQKQKGTATGIRNGIVPSGSNLLHFRMLKGSRAPCIMHLDSPEFIQSVPGTRRRLQSEIGVRNRLVHTKDILKCTAVK